MTAVMIAIAIAALIVMTFLWLGGRERFVVSAADGEAYSVREEFDNRDDAANMLADINRMYTRMITHLKRNRMDTPWAEQIEYLAKNYNPTVIGEHIPWNLNYTSYVADKGRKVRFCLRTPDDRRRFHDTNTIRFVALHELAHMMTRSFGHEPDFWDTFRFLLHEAEALGEVKLIDYRREPRDYCGVMIESNPALGRGA